jgi:hypothetical protein
MKPSELTPEALMKFFSEMESSGEDEGECEIHYGCSCVIQKGRRAAQMLLDIQKIVGAQADPGGAVQDDEAAMTARIMEVEAALMQSDVPAEPDANAEALQEAEGEIDRLLVQNVELKDQNEKLREKVRDLYKQVERLYTRSEMSKLLGTLDDKIEEETQLKEGDLAETGTGEEKVGEEGAAETEAAEEKAEESHTEPEETGNGEAAVEETAEGAPDGAATESAAEGAGGEDEAPEPVAEDSNGSEGAKEDSESDARSEAESATEADRDPS